MSSRSLYTPCKWIQPAYQGLRQRANLTVEQTLARCEELRKEYAHMDLGTVTRNQIDNPFATEDARKVMLNEIAAYKAK